MLSAWRRPCGFQPQPAPWPVRPPRRVGDSNTTGLTAQSLAATPGPWPIRSPFCVRRAGVEPARPRAPVPKTGVATSYTTSAWPLARPRVTDRIRTGPASLASSRANR
jgi:hypothetical protein